MTNESQRISLAEVVEFSRRWQRSRGRIDADIVTDPDGVPIAVGDSYPVLCAGLAISQDDADRLDILDGEFPGILILPNPTKRGNQSS